MHEYRLFQAEYAYPYSFDALPWFPAIIGGIEGGDTAHIQKYGSGVRYRYSGNPGTGEKFSLWVDGRKIYGRTRILYHFDWVFSHASRPKKRTVLKFSMNRKIVFQPAQRGNFRTPGRKGTVQVA